MKNESGSGGSSWTIVAALGGLLAGVASVLGLFIAKPEAISVFVPVQVLRDAVAAEDNRTGTRSAQADASDASSSFSPATAQISLPTETVEPAPDFSPAPAEPVSSLPAMEAVSELTFQSLGPDFSVALVSLAEDQSRYIATLRFENGGSSDVGLAVSWLGAYEGEMTLTDGVGGSCPFAANGEGWGTLSTAQADDTRGGGEFRVVQAGGRAQHTIFFNKSRCDTRITASGGLVVSGAFVVEEDGQRRSANIFFENLDIRRSP